MLGEQLKVRLKELKLTGSYEISLEPKEDHRGFFMRTYDDKIFDKKKLNYRWVQENHSLSVEKGVIRGLHFQFPPYAETKLVRVIKGAILDVFVDLRLDSKTFGQWDAIKLSEENRKMALIPQGFAHGFCTLSENCEVLYKVDNFYSPEYEEGISWNDSDLGIDWPVSDPVLSDKDKSLKSLKEFIEEYEGIDVS